MASVVELLDSGVDINARDGVGQTALIKAAWNGHTDMIRLLVEREAGLEFVDSNGYTALTHAIRHFSDPRPRKLLNEAGARSHLIDAFWANNLELVRTRLDERDDPNVGEGSYHGPILMEAARAGNVALIDLLLDFGANIEGEDDLGNRPLLCAADQGQIAAVQRLPERGADLDAQNWSQVSALGHAAVGDHHAIVELLLLRGARRGVVDALALDEPAILEILLDEALSEGRDVDWISDGRFRIAFVAATRGNLGMVRRLLDRGAALLLDRDPLSLLAEAARHGYLEVMQLLIERGASLDAVDRYGLTPLDWAIKAGQAEAVRLLQRVGAFTLEL